MIHLCASDAINNFSTDLPGLFTDGLSLDHKGLAHIGEVEIVIQFCCDPDFSRFNSSMLAVACMSKVQ